MAACLASTVAYNLINELSIKFSHSVFWMDSLTTLHLIHDTSKRFGVIVAGRLLQIRSLTPSSAWHHCPTAESPADIGMSIVTFKSSKKFSLWYNGSSFSLKSERF